MPEWVEQVVSRQIRIIATLADIPKRGRQSLTYRVRHDNDRDHGPFDTFEAALEVASALMPPTNVIPLRRVSPHPSDA
jgi:hypothetical protein